MVHQPAVWVQNSATAAKKCGGGQTWYPDVGRELEWSFDEFRLFKSHFGQETETPPRFVGHDDGAGVHGRTRAQQNGPY